MSRATEKARAELQRAEQDATRWETAVSEALAAAEDAACAVVADPGELEAVGRRAAATAATAEAARRGRAQAAERLDAARRRVLLAEADEQDAAASEARRALEVQERKVRNLLSQLEQLEEAPFEPRVIDVENELCLHGKVTYTVPVRERLRKQLALHEIRASVLRATATRGAVPVFAHELSNLVGGLRPWELLSGELVPESAREYARAVAPEEPPVTDEGPSPEPSKRFEAWNDWGDDE